MCQGERIHCYSTLQRRFTAPFNGRRIDGLPGEGYPIPARTIWWQRDRPRLSRSQISESLLPPREKQKRLGVKLEELVQ